MGLDTNESNKARIEWCISTVREIADLGRDKPLSDLYPQAVVVVNALKRVLGSTGNEAGRLVEESKMKQVIHKRYPNCLTYYCGKPDAQFDKYTKPGRVGSMIWSKVTCKKCLQKGKRI